VSAAAITIAGVGVTLLVPVVVPQGRRLDQPPGRVAQAPRKRRALPCAGRSTRYVATVAEVAPRLARCRPRCGLPRRLLRRPLGSRTGGPTVRSGHSSVSMPNSLLTSGSLIQSFMCSKHM